MRYRDAGVDVRRADEVKAELIRLTASTHGPAVRPLPGGFAGFIAWPGGSASAPGAEGRRPPLLAASMDGVGTKLHVALAAGRVEDAAADLVYHGANDLLVHGARPLAFLDYVAQGTLDPAVVLAVVRGLSRACGEVGAALLGGETAQMPDTYLPGVVDVAGCMIGWVDDGALCDGAAVRPGDVLLGLGSAGLHTNGFSLARRIVAERGVRLDQPLPGGAGETVSEALLAPHRWYGPALEPVLARGRVHALAHVTGGGIAGNLVRVLPAGCRAAVDPQSWPRPPLFRWLCEAGPVPEGDARDAFNLGLGMIVVCAAAEADGLAQDLAHGGERVYRVGAVRAGERGVEWTG